MENFKNNRHNVAYVQTILAKTAISAAKYARVNGHNLSNVNDLTKLLLSDQFRTDIRLESDSSIKKILNRAQLVWKKPSHRRINLFFNYLHKNFPRVLPKAKILTPDKEVEIQSARKAMLKAREAYEQALNEYKTVKGDYYKTKVVDNSAFTDINLVELNDTAVA